MEEDSHIHDIVQMEDVTEYYTECMPSVIKEIAVVNMLSKSKSKQKVNHAKTEQTPLRIWLGIHQLEAVACNVLLSMTE